MFFISADFSYPWYPGIHGDVVSPKGGRIHRHGMKRLSLNRHRPFAVATPPKTTAILVIWTLQGATFIVV
jgi:hypothetical protein